MLASVLGPKYRLKSLFDGTDVVAIGRKCDCLIQLSPQMAPDKSIEDSLLLQLSRCHAHLSVHDGQLQLSDDGTVNGTFVNNLRLSPHKRKVLKDGDVISFGGYVCFFNTIIA